MSYATQRDAFSRTTQDLVVVGVRECQNHYATEIQQLLTYTDQFDNAAWTKTVVTITPNDLTAPDGTVTADRTTFTGTGDAVAQTVSGETVTSNTYTFSIWLRAQSTTGTCTITVEDSGATETASEQITVSSSEWIRFSLKQTFSGTPTGDLVVRVSRESGDDLGVFYLWRANCTQNPSGAVDRKVIFPSVLRVAEAASTVSVEASRCQAVDAGDGSRCYFSRPTCQDPDNFNSGNTWENTAPHRGFREFRFCRKDAPLALHGVTVAPMLDRFDVAGQEIDAKRGVTVNERVNFTFEDDAGPGVWNPRQQQEGSLVNTASGGGTFWRRFLSIYRNYGNPKGYLIHKAGFVEAGGSEDEFQQRGKYAMRNFTLRANNRASIECTDRLKLARKNIPAKISEGNTLFAAIDASQTSIVVDNAGEVSTPPDNAGTAAADWFVVILIDSEKMTVTAVDLDTNTLTVQRGRWGSTAATHAIGATFTEIAEFGTEFIDPSGNVLGKNPLDIIRELYRYAGISDDDIDNTTFDNERDTWFASSVDITTGDQSGLLFRRTLTEIKKVEDLVKEIRELIMLMVWVGEDQMLTCKAFAHPTPTETLTTLTDDANIVSGSLEIEDDIETRLSRALIAWDRDPDEEGSKAEDYNKIQVYIALDEEEDPYYGEQIAKVILTEWIPATDTLTPESLAARLVSRFRNGLLTFRMSLEVKDDAVAVGTTVELQSDKLQTFAGEVQSRYVTIVKKKRRENGLIEVDGLELPILRQGFYAPDGLADYTSATDAEKRYGYFSDDQGLVGDPKETAYHYW